MLSGDSSRSPRIAAEKIGEGSASQGGRRIFLHHFSGLPSDSSPPDVRLAAVTSRAPHAYLVGRGGRVNPPGQPPLPFRGRDAAPTGKLPSDRLGGGPKWTLIRRRRGPQMQGTCIWGGEAHPTCAVPGLLRRV